MFGSSKRYKSAYQSAPVRYSASVPSTFQPSNSLPASDQQRLGLYPLPSPYTTGTPQHNPYVPGQPSYSSPSPYAQGALLPQSAPLPYSGSIPYASASGPAAGVYPAPYQPLSVQDPSGLGVTSQPPAGQYASPLAIPPQSQPPSGQYISPPVPISQGPSIEPYPPADAGDHDNAYNQHQYNQAANENIPLSQTLPRRFGGSRKTGVNVDASYDNIVGIPPSSILVNDGENAQSFNSSTSIEQYFRLFPEAENDQACRAIRYGSGCTQKLLLPLFEHFDYSRYSLFPYGFANDFETRATIETGACRCQKCIEGQPCGQYALVQNFQFYAFEETRLNQESTSPRVATTTPHINISTKHHVYKFYYTDWNLHVFHRRSQRNQTVQYAHDALVYQNYDGPLKLRSSPIDYVMAQLDAILGNWETLLNASAEFLASFRIEVLEERLESDRSIIRNLLLAAQHWEHFRRTLKTQLRSLEFMEQVHLDTRWTAGRDDLYQLQVTAAGYLQRLRAVEYRIATELLQETDVLVQRVTNLISIDEGYRSRDQNQSIRRLTWITFIFLPLVFTAGLFGMNVDLFRGSPSWKYYVYASLAVFAIVSLGYILLRSRRRALRALRLVLRVVLLPLVHSGGARERRVNDEEGSRGSEKDSSDDEDREAIILRWAASSGRTNVIREILAKKSSPKKDGRVFSSDAAGQALSLAIKNGHEDAAIFLISIGEGIQYIDSKGATPLHLAAQAGSSVVVQSLLDAEVLLSTKDSSERTALDYALMSNDEATINLLLRGGKQPTRQETSNIQSLHFAARSGDLDTLKSLHAKGSSIEVRDGKGQTALFHAIKGRQYNVVNWLLGQEANIQAIDRDGFTPLHIAVQVSDPRSVQMLLDRGADVNATSTQKLTPLLCIHGAAAVEILELLVGKNADLHACDIYSDGLVHKAAMQGDTALPLMEALVVVMGMDISAPGNHGNNAAHLAAALGSQDLLELLYTREFFVLESRNDLGFTPLMVAAREGAAATMSWLLDAGASLDVSDKSNQSLVQLALKLGNPIVMQVLQDRGAQFDLHANTTDTVHPIWSSIYEGRLASVELLLNSGVSVEHQKDGISLLQLAAEVDNVGIVKLLLERGAVVNQKDQHGWTPLHSAAYAGNIECILLLLQKGAEKTARDEQGWTSLDVAAFYRHEKVQEILDPESEITEYAWMRSSQAKLSDLFFSVPRLADSAITGIIEAPSPILPKRDV